MPSGSNSPVRPHSGPTYFSQASTPKFSPSTAQKKRRFLALAAARRAFFSAGVHPWVGHSRSTRAMARPPSQVVTMVTAGNSRPAGPAQA